MFLVPYDYRSTGQRMAAHVDLLYQDIQRLVRSDPALSPARIAEMANLSSAWVVRDIRKPDWFVKNVAHLFKIEAALRDHPNWHPKKVFDEKEYVAPDSYVLRRLVDPFEAPEFRELAFRWSARSDDATFVEQTCSIPWVNVVDVSPSNPRNYKIIKYDSVMKNTSGIDKQGIRLGDHANKIYATMSCEFFEETVSANEPRCRDVVSFGESRVDHVIYRSIALPCLESNIVITKLSLGYCSRSLGKNWRRKNIEGNPSFFRPTVSSNSSLA